MVASSLFGFDTSKNIRCSGRLPSLRLKSFLPVSEKKATSDPLTIADKKSNTTKTAAVLMKNTILVSLADDAKPRMAGKGSSILVSNQQDLVEHV